MNPRDVVAIPGRIGGTYTPWIAYPCTAAEQRGAAIHRVCWTTDVPDPPAQWVVDQVRPSLSGLDHPLLIGKSLGSHGAILAADLNLPAVWITPLLTPGHWYGDVIATALRRATAPVLLIGGTADPSWDGALARDLTPYVFEAPGADHGLFVPGPLAESAAVLGQMATAVETFLDEVIWPA